MQQYGPAWVSSSILPVLHESCRFLPFKVQLTVKILLGRNKLTNVKVWVIVLYVTHHFKFEENWGWGKRLNEVTGQKVRNWQTSWQLAKLKT